MTHHERKIPVWLTHLQIGALLGYLDKHSDDDNNVGRAYRAIQKAETDSKFLTFDEGKVLEIIQATADCFGVTREEILSASRERRCAAPRAIAMFLARRHTALSFPNLARLFERRDHTTVLSAYNRVRQKLKTNGGTVGQVLQIEARLTKTERQAS